MKQNKFLLLVIVFFLNSMFLISNATVFCLGQNIVDDIYHIEDDGSVFTTNLYDEGDKLNLFNWFIFFDTSLARRFSHITVDDNLNIEINIKRDFVLYDYSGIIKYKNGFLISDINFSNGMAKLVYVEDKNVEVLYDFSNAGKYKHSFFLNDKIFYTQHDLQIKNEDSLRLRFYKANFQGQILDSIIYSDFNPELGLNFNLINQNPFRDENGNVYLLGNQTRLFQPFNTYILKFNKNEELEFVNLIERQQDSLLPQPNNLTKYFDDKFLVSGMERDSKNKIAYAFIKVYDKDFNELSHYRYNNASQNLFYNVIVNEDSTLTLYGKNSKEFSNHRYYSSRTIIDKNFEQINFNTFESDTIDHGFHYAVSRKNFDIVIGYFRKDLYIAKIEKHFLGVKNNLDKFNAIYLTETNELIFNDEIPEKIEIIDLLGRNIYTNSKILTRSLNLPDLPENQVILVKIKYSSIEILQRIR